MGEQTTEKCEVALHGLFLSGKGWFQEYLHGYGDCDYRDPYVVPMEGGFSSGRIFNCSFSCFHIAMLGIQDCLGEPWTMRCGLNR